MGERETPLRPLYFQSDGRCAAQRCGRERERERGEGKRKKSYVLPLSSSASPLSQAFFCCCCLLCRFSFGFCQATDTSQWTQGVHERSEKERKREREKERKRERESYEVDEKCKSYRVPMYS